MKIIFIIFVLTSLCHGKVNGQGCIGKPEWELANGINDFRQKNGKPLVGISLKICQHALLKAKNLSGDNQTIDLPEDIYASSEKFIYLSVKNLNANAQNTLPTFTMKHPSLELWKVILEEGSFQGKTWKSAGLALYKNIALIWFSDKEMFDKPGVCDEVIENQHTEIIRPVNKETPDIGLGRWLITPNYYKMAYLNFEPELFPVANDMEKWGFIDKRGEVVIDFQYQRAYAFHEGLAAVMNQEGLYGYINPGGKLVIPFRYSYPGQFYNGKALVSENSKNFLINLYGERVSEEFTDMAWLNDNFYAFKQGNLYGIKDINGKLIKTPFFSDFYPFSEGLAGVKVNGKWGFMDENFNLVIKPVYTEKIVYAFQNGYARYKQNQKTGIIDKSGNIVLPAQYDDLYEFNEGLMAYQQNGKWGYINLNGETVIYPEYLSAYNFKYGMAVVKDTRLKMHLIDTRNNKLIYNTDDIIVFSSKLIGVNTKGGWGLFELP